MRVSNQSTFDAIKYQLAQSADSLVKANAVASSGKKISKLSDDPIGMVQVLSLKESLSNMDQLGRNISTARNWLNGGETALGSVKTIITDMKTLCIQMANGTVSAAERSSAAAQVQGALEQVVSLANTQVNGQYIFAGTNTGTNPFAIQTDTNGNPTGVAYSGNDAPFSLKIGKNTTVQVGQGGQAVFGDGSTGGIFNTLVDLKGYLENNDVAGIQQSMTALDTNLDQVSNAVSDIGAKGIQLDTKDKILQDMKLSYQTRQSSLEDADMVSAIADVTLKETAYQAALASSAKVMQKSLIDYL
jgi:flagellar hook-associated protein 3 FlgL